jgi:hypothetical protein
MLWRTPAARLRPPVSSLSLRERRVDLLALLADQEHRVHAVVLLEVVAAERA